uniref:Uncharacterized protein MANES_02G039200 n=1 Tax=Rhizophora mucronata TaxID=61149 RepID=A0A2P2LJQ8_RHIMU
MIDLCPVKISLSDLFIGGVRRHLKQCVKLLLWSILVFSLHFYFNQNWKTKSKIKINFLGLYDFPE